MGDLVCTHPHFDTTFDGLHGHILFKTQSPLELDKYFVNCIFSAWDVLGCKGLSKTIDERANMMQLIVVYIFARQGS